MQQLVSLLESLDPSGGSFLIALLVDLVRLVFPLLVFVPVAVLLSRCKLIFAELLEIPSRRLQMYRRKDADYPNEELPPSLRLDGAENAVRSRLRLAPLDAGSAALPPDLDPETEREYPYYQRTRHLIGDLRAHPELAALQNAPREETPSDAFSRSAWYGYDEWLQDLMTRSLLVGFHSKYKTQMKERGCENEKKRNR